MNLGNPLEEHKQVFFCERKQPDDGPLGIDEIGGREGIFRKPRRQRLVAEQTFSRSSRFVSSIMSRTPRSSRASVRVLYSPLSHRVAQFTSFSSRLANPSTYRAMTRAKVVP